MSLRSEQRALTREKILGAVIELVADGSLDELSVPAVARHSGVSLATIYRYFATKDDLIAAASDEPSRRASGQGVPLADGDALAAFQRTMWTSFAENLPLLRHQVSSAAGRQMRTARMARSRAMLAGHLADRGIDAETPEGDRLIALLLLLTGSLGLLELHDRQDRSVDESLAISSWAADALIDLTEQQQRREGASR